MGSGAGGATTAAVLAEAGHDVLIVEEGPWVEQGSVVPFSLDQMDRQYRSGGVTVALGLPSIAYTEGRCAGGGTEVNSGLYWRPPEATLDSWRTKYRIKDFATDDVLSICAEVESALSVQKVPGEHTPASDILRRGADRLGWENDEIPRWMTYPDGAGATEGQRQSMTRTYLPRAFAAGARILCEHRLDRIVRSGRRATSAELTDLAGSAEGHDAVTISFRDVIVCGGAIQTPAILQRAGLRHRVGRTLAVHPTVKLAARFDDAVNTPEDVSVYQVKQFAPNISFGGSASHPGLVALALTDNWRDFGSAVTSWPEVAIYYAAITSEGRGRVQAIPGVRDPLVTYRLTKRDRDLLGQGLGRLAMVMLEAGADEVYPVVQGCAGRAQPRRPGHDDDHVRRHQGERDDGPSLLDCADGRRRAALRDRQPRSRARHRQRLRQRRGAAPRGARRQPAGVGDGRGDPQCSPLLRRPGRMTCRMTVSAIRR